VRAKESPIQPEKSAMVRELTRTVFCLEWLTGFGPKILIPTREVQRLENGRRILSSLLNWMYCGGHLLYLQIRSKSYNLLFFPGKWYDTCHVTKSIPRHFFSLYTSLISQNQFRVISLGYIHLSDSSCPPPSPAEVGLFAGALFVPKSCELREREGGRYTYITKEFT
jgi:hypothetical protein